MIIQPKGKQVEVLGIRDRGHFVVLGTAGSGKTTIALLRAINLANLSGNDKVLLVTFNGALVEYMKGIENISRRLTIENYHKFARGYLASRGKMPTFGGIVENEQREKLIDSAVEILKKEYPVESTFKRKQSFFYDEIQFIEEFGCDSLEKYCYVERTGRSEAFLKKDKRPYIYMIYEKYMELRTEAHKCYDWYDLAMYVASELEQDTNERRYKHIIIDEGQDFSPMMIKSLVKAIPSDGSFTFFGDVAQQIYGNRMSWKESGINIAGTWRFAVNYRNPETVVAFAKVLAQSKYWKKSEDMVDCEAANAKGPKPVLIKFNNEEQERLWIVNRAIQESKKSSVVIICRNRNDIDTYLSDLKDKGCIAIEINKHTAGFSDRKQVYLSTYHSVKGLEFYNVFMPALTVEKLPDHDMVDRSEEISDAYADELKLLYVAATRSKYGLYMSYSGSLTELFPYGTETVDMREV